VRQQNKDQVAGWDDSDRRPLGGRDPETWALYGLLGMVGYLLTALGATLAPLQRDLDVARTQVAFYPSLFAAGLVVIGVAGTAVVGRIGRVVYSRLALLPWWPARPPCARAIARSPWSVPRSSGSAPQPSCSSFPRR
jgi:hypothetical protein